MCSHPNRSEFQPEARWRPGPVLGIESSCDETAAAVLSHEGEVLSNVVSSQVAVHEKFGGVVPELAARAHLGTIDMVVQEALATAHVPKNALVRWPSPTDLDWLGRFWWERITQTP